MVSRLFERIDGLQHGPLRLLGLLGANGRNIGLSRLITGFGSLHLLFFLENRWDVKKWCYTLLYCVRVT